MHTNTFAFLSRDSRAFLSSLALVSCLSVASLSSGQAIFDDDFSDNAAGWTLESLTGNFGFPGSDAEFGYDYSSVGIPEAPNSDVPGGDTATNGVRLRTNTGGLATDQAAIYIDDVDFTGKYTVQVDMWLNWPPDPLAVGTTIHGGLYVGNALPGDLNSNKPIQRGAGYIASSDGDCANCDHILLKNEFELDTFSGQYSVVDLGFGNQPGFDDSDVNTDPLQGELIDIPAIFPGIDIDTATGGLQSSDGTQQPSGSLGFRWVTVTAEVDPIAVGNGPNSSDLGTTTFSITNAANSQTLLVGTVDNSQPDILDDDGDGDECSGGEDICVNLNNPFDGDVPVGMEGRVSLAIIDFFQGAGSNINLSFALFDNLKVFETAVGLAGDYNGNGTVDAADFTVWRDTEGSSVTAGTGADGDGDGMIGPGDYTVWVNNFGASSPASATSVPEPTTLGLASLMLLTGILRRRRRFV